MVDLPLQRRPADTSLQKSQFWNQSQSASVAVANILLGFSSFGKEDFLSDEFEKFISTNNVSNINDLKGLGYFFAYISHIGVRNIVNQQDFTELYHNACFNVEDFNRVDDGMQLQPPYYINTFVPLNTLNA